MRLSPEFVVLELGPMAEFPHASLRQGVWLIQRGGQPPSHHDPARLLRKAGRAGGIALSLTTAAMLQADLALVLAGWLARQGRSIPAPGILALHEVLLNAAIHGNLEVVSGPLSDWSNLVARETLIAAALQDPSLRARMVTVALAWNSAGAAFAAVADEGAGYVMAEAEQAWPPDGRRAAGRGLMLARAAATVELCDGGRCTFLAFDTAAALGAPS